MRIAVVGTGISGLGAAWALSHHGHEIHLFEKNLYVGGHSNTVTFRNADGQDVSVDTGFIVYNNLNYPNLRRMFELLGVVTQESEMSFAVSADRGGFEYAGTNLLTFFAQFSNIFSLKFFGFMREIMRFNKESLKVLEDESKFDMTLGEYLDQNGYSEGFRTQYLLPMCAAIWSAPMGTMMQYPITTLVRFFHNHCLMQATGRPQWRTVTGGSQQYVSKIKSMFADRITLNAAIVSIDRAGDKIVITDSRHAKHEFDKVILATHSDQALKILGDAATPLESEILSKINYQKNVAWLHTDKALMPVRKLVWSSWNVLVDRSNKDGLLSEDVCLTYWMNNLQRFLPKKQELFVTLNPKNPPTQDRVIKRIEYDHPIYTPDALRSQKRMREIQGTQNTYYCGAYCGYGFHEDGLTAGLRVAEAISPGCCPFDIQVENRKLPEESGGSNTLIYVGLALGLAAGLYLRFGRPSF
eukprot:TRINITY_DN17594_c0_g1_i1.p1 TRINITY_DN17594_c0_g1~~TRINITY_DN17594_c0_g1_i1.p1  ORF type:complete len:469 (+),score=94.23 TRINITY_DN17594_c0_g1_i1:50-1456(+)